MHRFFIDTVIADNNMRLERVLVGLLAVSAFEIPLQLNKRVDDSLLSEVLNAATSTSLDNKQNNWYVGNIYVGTPPQVYTVSFVIESPWTWLTDVSCGANCHDAKPFDRNKSTTFEGSNESPILYREVGHLGYDAMSFNASEVQVRRQPFLLMTYTAHLENYMNSDGEVVRTR